jgi:hypothetical protein
MYGFPIKPCLHGLIGRYANVGAMYGLAKHCHTLDFLDNVRTNVQFSNQAMFTWLDWKKCQAKKQCKNGKAMISA